MLSRNADGVNAWDLCGAGPVEFRSSEGTVPNDEAFLRMLAKSAATPARPSAAASASKSQIRKLAKLPLHENDVAKVRVYFTSWKHSISLRHVAY